MANNSNVAEGVGRLHGQDRGTRYPDWTPCKEVFVRGIGHAFFAIGLLCAVLSAGSAAALTLSGKAVSADNTPVAGASVWLCRGLEVRTAKTDGGGGFSFTEVGIGDVSVVAFKEGYSVGGYSSLVAEDTETLIRLLPPETLTLRVINTDMNPVPGVRVRFLWVSSAFWVPVESLAEKGFPLLRSGDQGLLEIPLLPVNGHVKLLLTHPQYADTLVPYLPVAPKRQDIVVYRGIMIRGRVTHGGEGVSQALVSVFQPGVGQEQPSADTLSDPEGVYHLRVKSGDYLVNAKHPVYASPPAQPVSVQEPDTEYTVDFELITPKVIHGSVLFPDGTPCAAARVLFRAQDGVLAEGISESDGRFRLNIPVEKGTAAIIPPPGFMTASLPDIPVDFKGETQAELAPIRLKELPLIGGTVTYEDGQPAPQVLISSLDLELPVWAITNAQGKFSLRLIYMPESRRATFRAEHHLRFLRQDFSVDLGAPAPATVSLRPFAADQAHRPAVPGRNDLTRFLDKPAPELTCSDWFNSVPLSLASLKGKVVVMTFWGGFDESPEGLNRLELLRALHDLYRDTEDVAIVGIHDCSSDANEIEEYVHRFGLTFPVGRDGEPFVSFVNYNVNFIPQTVLIDKEGVFRYFEIEGRMLELIKTLRRAG